MITRIDILLPISLDKMKRQDTVLTIARILRNPIYKNRVFVYNNERDYNYNTPYIINDKISEFLKAIPNGGYIAGNQSDNKNIIQNYKNGKGRVSKTYLTTPQCVMIGGMLAPICKALNLNIEEATSQALRGYSEYVGQTQYNQAYYRIIRNIQKFLKKSEMLNQLQTSHFGHNLKGDLRDIYGYIMELLHSACKQEGATTWLELKHKTFGI